MVKELRELADRLERFQSVRDWKLEIYTKRSQSDHTLTSYYRYLDGFRRFSGLNPDEMIEAAKKDQKDVEKQINRYLATYIDRGKFRASVYAFRVLQSFFKHVADIRIKTRPPQTDKGIVQEGTPIPTEEEFQKMLQYAPSLRDRFLLVFLRQTGVRAGAIPSMKLKHIKDLQIGKDGSLTIKRMPVAIEVYPESRDRYFTFLASDGAELMLEYLRERQRPRHVKTRTGRVVREGEAMSAESPLFMKSTAFALEKRDFLTEHMVNRVVLDIRKRAGLEKPVSPQGLRRMCQNILESSGIHANRVEALMGHSLGLKAHYSIGGKVPAADLQQKIDELRNEYAKAEDKMVTAPKRKEPTKLDRLRQQLELWGLNPDEVIREEAAKKLAGMRMAWKGPGPKPRPSGTYEFTEKEQIWILQEKIKEILEIEKRGYGRKTYANGGKPFESRIIGEEELTAYLDEGWDLVKELSNGKIVIRRPLEA